MRVHRPLPTWFLAALVFGAGYMFYPFLPWIVLALWLGLYARRVHVPLTRWLGGRVRLSAGITVSLLLLVVAPIALVVTSVVLDAIALVQRLLASEQAKAVLIKLVQGSDTTAHPIDGITDLLVAQGDRAWAILQSVAGAAARFAIGVLIMVTGMYGILVEGGRWFSWVEDHLPLSPAHFRRLGAAFMETGGGLWWGIVGAGLVQSIVATIAYLVLGVPSAIALGGLTLLFSVIPAVGTAIVWAPVAAGLAITGRPIEAVILAIIGVAVISTVDNLARPWLTHRGHLALPTWIVLLAMFGGIELFGGWGLVLGPLLVRLAKEALVISREVHDPATSSPIPSPPGPPVETTTAT